MHDVTVWLVGTISAVAAGAFVAWLFKKSGRALERRRAEMRLLARRLGLRYYGSPGPEAVGLLPAFSLLERGYAQSVANLIAEDRRPPRALLFDYRFMYTQASGEPRPSEADYPVLHVVAMAAFAGDPQVERVRVFLTDWLGGPVGVPGLYSLEFQGDPSFGSRYLFAGGPQEAVRRMLTPAVQDALAGWSQGGPKPVVEIVPGWAIAFVESDAGDRRVAERAAALLTYATGIAKALGGP